eukprot:SAG31_NODE_9348_length_1291_cov_1.820470_1_plen_70_part_00
MIPSASGGADEITEGGQPLRATSIVKVLAEHVIVNAITYVSLQVPSGDYTFASAWNRDVNTMKMAIAPV